MDYGSKGAKTGAKLETPFTKGQMCKPPKKSSGSKKISKGR